MSCPLRESLTLASAVNGTRARLFGRRGQGPNGYAILMNSNKGVTVVAGCLSPMIGLCSPLS